MEETKRLSVIASLEFIDATQINWSFGILYQKTFIFSFIFSFSLTLKPFSPSPDLTLTPSPRLSK